MKKVYLLFILISIYSCEQIVTKENDKQDIELANKVSTNFYNQIIENDTLSIFNKLDSSINKDEFAELINANKKDFGNILKVDIVKTNTIRVVKNNMTNLDYKIELNVEYEKNECTEYLMYIGESEDKLVLNKYLINPKE